MRSLIVPLLLSVTLCLSLTTCETLGGIIATEPPKPTDNEVVRVLCARAPDGKFIFGPVAQSHKDVLTDYTQRWFDARNAAWDAATKNGELCGKLGAAEFGGVKWGAD